MTIGELDRLLYLHRIYHPAGALCCCGWTPKHKPENKAFEEVAHRAHLAEILSDTALQKAARESHSLCLKKDWDRQWSNGGCYLHLEVSEFIEALRGKGNPLEEAGDVMFVLLSMLVEAKLDPEVVLRQVHRKIELITAGKHKPRQHMGVAEIKDGWRQIQEKR